MILKGPKFEQRFLDQRLIDGPEPGDNSCRNIIIRRIEFSLVQSDSGARIGIVYHNSQELASLEWIGRSEYQNQQHLSDCCCCFAALF